MNNNRTNNGNNVRTKEDIRQGLFAMPVGLNMSGVQFTEKLSALCSKIETVFVRDIGMEQLIQVAIKPNTTRDGIVKGMEMKFYFDTTINSGSNAYIARGRSNGNYNNGGEESIYDLMGVNNTTQDGGFRPSTEFKQLISPFIMRRKHDNNHIDIKSLPRQSHIATILMDDLAVISFLLGIQPNDPYETVVTAAHPLENGYNGDVDDYIIIFTKAITSPGHKKNRKSPIDCTKYDPTFNRNNRRDNDDRNNNDRNERRY